MVRTEKDLLNGIAALPRKKIFWSWRKNLLLLNELAALYWQKKSSQAWNRFTDFRSHAGTHGLRTPREDIIYTVRPKIQSQSKIFRYGWSIFCLPHRPNFSDIFDLCLHGVYPQRTPNKAFFIEIQNVCAWADKLSK